VWACERGRDLQESSARTWQAAEVCLQRLKDTHDRVEQLVFGALG